MQIHVREGAHRKAHFLAMWVLQKEDTEGRCDPKQMSTEPRGKAKAEPRVDAQGQGAVSFGDLLGPHLGDHGENRPVEDVRHLAESVPYGWLGEVWPAMSSPRSSRGVGRWGRRG